MSTTCVVECNGSCVISGGTCKVKLIPAICEGALVVGMDANNMPIYADDTVYNIGRLNSLLPGYNPNNDWVPSYEYTTTDLVKRWQPAIYHVSGGVITSGGIIAEGDVITSGAVIEPCEDSYNVASDDYYVVSWYEPAVAAGS